MMKILTLLTLAFAFFDCSPKQRQGNAVSETTTMEDTFNFSGKKSDVSYTISGTVGRDRIKIKYVLQNTGKKDLVLFNRGDTNFELKKGVVYTSPSKDGVVEISQRSFVEPPDSGCPDREYPVRAGASWLRAGEKVTEEIEVQLPLKGFTPFNDCQRLAPLPEKVSKVKFCLGFAEADPLKVTIDNKGFTKNWQDIQEQMLICSDPIVLK